MSSLECKTPSIVSPLDVVTFDFAEVCHGWTRYRVTAGSPAEHSQVLFL